jgi:hypothetical protein
MALLTNGPGLRGLFSKKYVGFCVKVPREGLRPMRGRGTENGKRDYADRHCTILDRDFQAGRGRHRADPRGQADIKVARSIYRTRVDQYPGRLIMLCDGARVIARSDRPNER